MGNHHYLAAKSVHVPLLNSLPVLGDVVRSQLLGTRIRTLERNLLKDAFCGKTGFRTAFFLDSRNGGVIRRAALWVGPVLKFLSTATAGRLARPRGSLSSLKRSAVSHIPRKVEYLGEPHPLTHFFSEK